MKNKKKKKINILKNISSLKKDLLNPKIISNEYILNENIDNVSKAHKSKLAYNIELVNNINSDEEENVKEILEKLYQNELNKFKINDLKKEKLKNINLLEAKAEYLYNWDSLLNRKISFKKRNEYDQKTLKKKFNSYNLNSFNSIDYSKGKNVISQISNEVLLNYYKELAKLRKNTAELSPKVKIKHKNIISNLVAAHNLAFSDKEKILNFLILSEKEINNFTEHELKIAAKRRTADVLIKSSIKSIINNNKKKEKIKNEYNYSDRNIKKNKTEKKKGLILSTYDEDNPYIKIFNKEMKTLSLDNKEKIGEIFFEELDKNLSNNIQRNIFSAKNLQARKFSLKNMIKDKDDLKNYCSGTTNASIHNNTRNIQNKRFNSFKNKRYKIENNFSFELNSNKTDKTKGNTLFHSAYSSRMQHSNNNKSYFINNKSIKKIMSYDDFYEIGFMNVFPRKESSKVGNIIYDKINKLLKFRYLKKFKLNEKYYTKNLISKTINSRYHKDKEESKNNKLVQTYLSENLKTSISKTTDSDMLSNISKYKESKKIFLKGENKNKIKRSIKNFFSCSNNYIVNLKRKNKRKFLNELSDKDYLNNMMNEFIYEDKFTKSDSTRRIKSIYSHNE